MTTVARSARAGRTESIEIPETPPVGVPELVAVVVLELVVVEPVVSELLVVTGAVELVMKVMLGTKSLASLEESTLPKPVTKSHPLPEQ
jgi:hypothetical protein